MHAINHISIFAFIKFGSAPLYVQLITHIACRLGEPLAPADCRYGWTERDTHPARPTGAHRPAPSSAVVVDTAARVV